MFLAGKESQEVVDLQVLLEGLAEALRWFHPSTITRVIGIRGLSSTGMIARISIVDPAKARIRSFQGNSSNEEIVVAIVGVAPGSHLSKTMGNGLHAIGKTDGQDR
jgi:hypothetical protein